MPYKLFQKLGMGELKPTSITLQLADQLNRHPKGIIEDVLIEVNKWIFSVVFVVLDIDDDVEVPLILRRPFLRMAKALIDMDEEEMMLRVGDETVT